MIPDEVDRRLDIFLYGDVEPNRTDVVHRIESREVGGLPGSGVNVKAIGGQFLGDLEPDSGTRACNQYCLLLTSLVFISAGASGSEKQNHKDDISR